MKWLKSTTPKSWFANGKLIPSSKDGAYLQLEDSDYESMKQKAVIASLIKAGGIIVLETEPAELKNSVESLQGSNQTLIDENSKLNDELATLTQRCQDLEKQLQEQSGVDIEAIKAEAVEAIKAEAVAELQTMQDQLDTKDRTIKDLEKKLKKATKAE